MRRPAATAAAFLTTLAVAVPAQAASTRFFGVVYDREVSTAPAQTQDAQFALMRRSGVRSVRSVFSWADSQPNAGQAPDFTATDALVERASRNDIQILPIVMYAPAWARADAENVASPPRDDADYAHFLDALVARYGPSGSFWSEHPDAPKRPLRVWQVWNEPQLRYQWSDPDWAPGYGALLRASYAALKKDDPGCKVVLAGATNYAWDALETLYEKGHVKGSFDIAALHPYTGSAPRVVVAAKLFRAVLKRHGDARKPLWITELAWPASKGRVKPPRGLQSLPTTIRGMATRLTRAYQLLRKGRLVQRAYWYTWASSYVKRDGIFAYTGLERYDAKTGTFKAMPALRAYRRAATGR